MPNGKALTIEAERWLALNEALEHIRRVQNCTPIDAQRQLKVHIADGIIPVKWADSEGTNDLPDPRYLQGTKLILSGSGLAHDSDAYRPLMILRSAVLRTWQHGKGNGNPSKEVESAKHRAPSNKNRNDRLGWITLVDAEEHIEVLQKCDSVEALRQLKAEIGDGIVAVKWADNPTDNPDVTILKTTEFILTGPGFAPDGKEYRPLLIFRADILRLWPEERDLVKRMPVEQSNNESGRGRPSARDQIWAALAEMQNEGSLPPNGNQKQIATEVAKRLNHEIGSRGWSERTIVEHISDWQKENAPADSKMRK